MKDSAIILADERTIAPARMNEPSLRRLIEPCQSRAELWASFIQDTRVRKMAEVGVLRGEFAARMLDECPGIAAYYMIDPWRHLDDWNKPANRADAVMEEAMREVLVRTSAHERKRFVLRGRTSEVIGAVPDGSLDLAYIDGDHTLRGITIDLIRLVPKVRRGGWIGGDDLSPTIWQHDEEFEPTLVFPFALYFAEAMGVPIFALPFKQFLIHNVQTGFAFADLAGGRYRDQSLRAHDFVCEGVGGVM